MPQLKFGSILRKTVLAGLSLSFFVLFLLACIFFYLQAHLPDVETLKDVQLQQPLRVYTKDKKLIAEFGQKRRIPVKLEEVPKPLVNAILATEDQRFFEHPGVDFLGLVRAFIQLAKTGKKSQGASTITMQVARNFFLSRKKTYVRKANEIFLAIKIDKELSKKKILELYLNKIYFGHGAYGVAAAAEVYYGKKLSELNLSEMAMLAGLPKAPSRINPISNKESAMKRRSHVLERMLNEGHINQDAYQDALNAPIHAKYHKRKVELHAPYVAEAVRRTLYSLYGEQAYTLGLKVYTTVDGDLQEFANSAMLNGLTDYDKRHGYRGPVSHENNLEKALEQLSNMPNYDRLKAAVVIDFDKTSASCQLKNGSLITIPMENIKWARAQLKKGGRGRTPSLPNDVVDIGDIIYVEKNKKDQWLLSQIPEIEGALVSLHPVDGRLLALVGGFRFHKSHYNRALQAYRQSGSCFKPFIYSAALEKGYTLASIINDAPVVMDDPSQDNYMWRPENSSRQFNGPTRLRLGLIRSRNLVSIRLLESIGLDYAVRFIERFGFDPKAIPRSLSLALGSAEVSPLDLTTGIASFANGGYKVNPYLIDTIVDTYGETILQSQPVKACIECIQDPELIHQIPLTQRAEQIVSPQVAYLMNIALKDTIQSGTGRRAKVLKRSDIAGKTGTTNDQVDAWFTGFNTQIVSTVWVGFDNPHSLYEYGNSAALPIWINFMKGALAKKPETHLPEPAGIITMRIDPNTGLLAGADHPKSIFETFRQEYAPTHIAPIKASDNTSKTEQEEIEHLF